MTWLAALKALHVVCGVAFVTGLLLLAVLAQLQQALPAPSWPQERRLLHAALAWNRRITGPALLLLWALGVFLTVRQGLFGVPWLSAKLVLVTALSASHGVLTGRLQRLACGQPAAAPGLASRAALPAAGLAVAIVIALGVGKPG